MASRLTLLLMPPSNTKTASRMPKRRRKVLNSPCSVVVSPRLPRKTSKCRDRKSTRLNSSHGYISYAVFCLKKKNEDGSRLLLPLQVGHRPTACSAGGRHRPSLGRSRSVHD